LFFNGFCDHDHENAARTSNKIINPTVRWTSSRTVNGEDGYMLGGKNSEPVRQEATAFEKRGWARVTICVCCVILFCAAILVVAQTETGRHILRLLVTGGAKG
jgi:hypothetical protein